MSSRRRELDACSAGSRADPWPALTRLSTAGHRSPGAAPDAEARLAQATNALRLWRPDLSANGPPPDWLRAAASLLAIAFSLALVVDWRLALTGAGWALAPVLLMATALRILACLELVRHLPPAPETQWPAPPPAEPLPSYAVLVPLCDEAAVLPSLVEHMLRLDYPSDRLDIYLVLESRDSATRGAAACLDLPANVHVVVVPDGGPRTKPKALDYALTFIESELVVVFDAEDRPDPDQLLKAAALFSRSDNRLACLQGRLNVYAFARSFWTRQFTLEYSALFDAMLPALERLGGPLPLGGTSNHFRAAALRQAGAWDPYNVTEDADLGIRLARLGYTTATFVSTTWEEAPPRRPVWLGQRRRWLKGWMQTWLVHMRHPVRLVRELGLWRFLVLQVVMAGVLLPALVYPVVLALAVAMGLGFYGKLPALVEAVTQWPLAGGLALTFAGFAAPMLAAAMAVVRRGRARLLWQVPLMPLYWLMISVAGYQALVELVRRPFHWEKTAHGEAGAPGQAPPPHPMSSDRAPWKSAASA